MSRQTSLWMYFVTEACLLIGDIGGTHARFALADPAPPGYDAVIELACADFESSGDAIRHYLHEVGADSPARVCIAAAGPVVDGSVSITNNHWTISTAALHEVCATSAVQILNDFEAVAYSLPFLAADDVLVIGGHEHTALPDTAYDVAILGPGTGLGVAGLTRRGDTLIAITGEGGHVGFAPETALQDQLLEALRKKFDRVSAERLVAGSGLQNIHAALAAIKGVAVAELSAAEIFAAAAEGDPLAIETVSEFFAILGQVAGDLALTLGAHQGVYIAGGIAKRYPELLAASRFRVAFESKGRHRAIMEKIPTLLITHAQPGLLGAAYCVLSSPGPA